MRNIDFLKLYADAAGLRIMVLANRLACETDRERALHDWVEQHLARFIAFTRSALEAERPNQSELKHRNNHRNADYGSPSLSTTTIIDVVLA